MEFCNREMKVLDSLHRRGVIVNTPYDIEESMLTAYIQEYGDLFSVGNGKLSKSDVRLARKLAGRTLIKHNIFNGASVSEIKAGMVYVITNPAYSEHFKIGMTVDLTKRLKSYQTYDPFRKFEVKHYEFVLNRRETEKAILVKFGVDVGAGEWVESTKYSDFLGHVKQL